MKIKEQNRPRESDRKSESDISDGILKAFKKEIIEKEIQEKLICEDFEIPENKKLFKRK